MAFVRRVFPVMVMLVVIILLGYPLAFLFGLPLALRDMRDLHKWEERTFLAQPPAELPAALVEGASAAEQTGSAWHLPFARDVKRGVLVQGGAPVPWNYQWEDGSIRLSEGARGKLVTWQEGLEPLSATIYSLGKSIKDGATGAIYVGTQLAQKGAVKAHERPDGRRTTYSFSADSGTVLVNDQVLSEGRDYRTEGNTVIFEEPPEFLANVRRITGDYAVLDADAGTIAFDKAPSGEVRAANSIVRLAEVLAGDSNGENRRFELPRKKLVENGADLAVSVGDTQLSGIEERPEERVDGTRRTFTFASVKGIVTLNGQVITEGVDYQRDGRQITFSTPPERNARLRQYLGFYLADPATGEVFLAQAPEAGATVWTDRYTVYAEPSCGMTVLECFYALPQYPVPFPHWIATSIVPFFQQYPITDPHNVLRSTLYTALGTLAALALGGAVGIILAVLFVLFRPLERALMPWTVASQTVPIIALVPILLLILGNFGITIQTSLLPTAIIGAYICFFPVVISTVKGLRAIDPLALDLMHSYAAGKFQIFWKLRFPAAVPFFFTGLKLGTAAALVGALVAETESNNSRGLGFQIIGQVQSGDVADVWILLIISGLLGIGLVALVSLLQRLIAPWEQA